MQKPTALGLALTLALLASTATPASAFNIYLPDAPEPSDIHEEDCPGVERCWIRECAVLYDVFMGPEPKRALCGYARVGNWWGPAHNQNDVGHYHISGYGAVSSEVFNPVYGIFSSSDLGAGTCASYGNACSWSPSSVENRIQSPSYTAWVTTTACVGLEVQGNHYPVACLKAVTAAATDTKDV